MWGLWWTYIYTPPLYSTTHHTPLPITHTHHTVTFSCLVVGDTHTPHLFSPALCCLSHPPLPGHTFLTLIMFLGTVARCASRHHHHHPYPTTEHPPHHYLHTPPPGLPMLFTYPQWLQQKKHFTLTCTHDRANTHPTFHQPRASCRAATTTTKQLYSTMDHVVP